MKLQAGGTAVPVAKGARNLVEYVLVLVPAVQPHQLFGTVNPVAADSRLHVKGVGVIGVTEGISVSRYSQNWVPAGADWLRGMAVGVIAG